MSSKNDSKRFLVIGSNSFSGSHFIRRLIGEGIPPLFVKKVFKELII